MFSLFMAAHVSFSSFYIRQSHTNNKCLLAQYSDYCLPVIFQLIPFVLIFVGIFFNRVWYSFGYPVYTTLQRCLLLDTWLLSRSVTRSLRKLLAGLLLLLVPLFLLFLTTCSLHYFGVMNIAPCAPVTGVYYVTKQVCTIFTP